MQIITGNKTIDYSMTPGGSLMRVIRCPQGTVIHSTSDTQKMLGLMLYDEQEHKRFEKQKMEYGTK